MKARKFMSMLALSALVAGAGFTASTTGLTDSVAPPVTAQAAPKTYGSMKATAVLNKWKANKGSSKFSGTVPKGATVQWLGSTQNGRHKVLYKGQTFWVTAKYAPRATTAAKPAPAQSASSIKTYGTVSATAALNKWKSNTGSSKFSGTVPKGGGMYWAGSIQNGRATAVYKGQVFWVTYKYIKAGTAKLPASKPTASKPVAKSACQRGIDRAIRAVGTPPSTTFKCGPLKAWKDPKVQGAFQAGDYNFSTGAWYNNVIEIRSTLSEKLAYESALHEIGHARFYGAPLAKQNKAMAAVGVKSMESGSYYNQHTERIAQAMTVYVGGASWWKYKPVTRAHYNAFYNALR